MEPTPGPERVSRRLREQFAPAYLAITGLVQVLVLDALITKVEGGYAGVDEETARLLFATQRPAAAAQFADPSGPPAWRTIPSWGLIGTLDRVIPATLQEEMYERAGAQISRVKAGHLSLLTRPNAVVRVILSAVKATS